MVEQRTENTHTAGGNNKSVRRLVMTTKERRRVSIQEAERIIKESRDKDEAVARLHSLIRRQPAPPPPAGGICLREASRKYSVSHPTLSRRVKDGTLRVLARTKNWLYIDETELRKFLENHGN